MDKKKMNKKKIIATIIGVTLIVGSFVACNTIPNKKVNNKPVKVSAEVKKDKKTKKVDKKEVKNVKKDKTQATSKVATNSTTRNNKITSKNTTSNKVTPKSNKKITFSDKKTSTKPAKKKVWVVDKAAWTETVTKYRQAPVTVEYAQFPDGTQIPFSRVHEDGTDDYGSEGMAAVNAYWRANVETNGSWRNGYRTEYEQVPYTETINHPEEGHWEYR